jgi:hypothetical protein
MLHNQTLLNIKENCINYTKSHPDVTEIRTANYLYAYVNPYPANVKNIVSSKYNKLIIVFQYISNKMQRYTVYLCLETTLHVLGGISTHHQEGIQLYLQHLVFVTPLLLSAAIVEELEPV